MHPRNGQAIGDDVSSHFLLFITYVYDDETGTEYGLVLAHHRNRQETGNDVSSLSLLLIRYVHENETAESMGEYYTDKAPNLEMEHRSSRKLSDEDLLVEQLLFFSSLFLLHTQLLQIMIFPLLPQVFSPSFQRLGAVASVISQRSSTLPHPWHAFHNVYRRGGRGIAKLSFEST